MHVEVRESRLEPWEELRRYEQQLDRQSGMPGKFGAAASFIGTMRDFNDATPVSAMTLEHYAGMTEKYLARIAEEAQRRWGVIDLLIVHRVGALLPGDPIVLIGVWAAHRAAAFEACRYLIEELKARAPFWKKEETGGEERWVEQNTPQT